MIKSRPLDLSSSYRIIEKEHGPYYYFTNVEREYFKPKHRLVLESLPSQERGSIKIYLVSKNAKFELDKLLHIPDMGNNTIMDTIDKCVDGQYLIISEDEYDDYKLINVGVGEYLEYSGRTWRIISKTASSVKVALEGNILEEEKAIVPLMEKEPEQIVPSRKVTVNTNETLSITYPGYGWIYLGSESENNNLVSTGRKVENEETVYTLTAKRAGTQLQHFYKVDTITGNFIDDWIEVEVLDNKGSVYTIVKAPDYAEIVPERPETPAVASSKKNISTAEILEKEVKPTEKRSYENYVPEPEVVNTTVTETIIPEPSVNDYKENLSADDLLLKAQSLFNEKQFVESQKYVNNFLEIATNRRDEGLFLQGQILEQDGVTKNIKESIASYTNLIENFPESDLWDAANKRIIYLNRFYIQIR